MMGQATEPIAKARTQASWQVGGSGQAPFRGVPVPRVGAQSRVQQQVPWVGVGTKGVALQ